MAERASVSLADWDVDDLPSSALRFVAGVCGFTVGDEVIAAPGHIGVVLPLLPDVAPARTRLDAGPRRCAGNDGG